MTPDAGSLALLGGAPVRTRAWPAWPCVDGGTASTLTAVLSSGRWSVTNPSPRGPTREHEFARRFAALYELPYCVPVSSGSAALKVALLAVGVLPLDKVAIPGLTWAAVGGAVANVGAIPVPVDVERESLCLSAAALKSMLARSRVRPAAVVVVHQNCAVADMAALSEVATRYGLPLVEDCSQAHGATVNGRPVGGTGAAGIFSLQQNKMLTCGEGGAVVTADPVVYALLQQFRSVGREYDVMDDGSHVGLRDVGQVIGDSVVLSEFHAAVLLDQLERFPAQHERRLANVLALERLLEGQPFVRAVTASPPSTVRGYHKYVWRLDDALLAQCSAATFAAALGAELGREIGLVDAAYGANPLLDDGAVRRRVLPRGGSRAQTHDLVEPSDPLTEAKRARAECFHLRHDAFLGDEEDMADVAAAITKVASHARALARYERQVMRSA